MAPDHPLQTVIIDDEPASREDLRRLLAARAEFVVVGEAGRIVEAEALLHRANYDLVLLDVELRGGNGFDLLPHVRPGARVVFVTAHSHYAVRAFEINALDYLVKPITAARLESALRRVGSESGEPVPPHRNLIPTDLVHLKIGNGTTRFVALAEIADIESEGNYTTVRLGGGPRLLVRRTLKGWEDVLPPAQFARVHRTTIVNLARYRGLSRLTEQTTLLHLDGLAEPVRASFRYVPELRVRLAALGRPM